MSAGPTTGVPPNWTSTAYVAGGQVSVEASPKLSSADGCAADEDVDLGGVAGGVERR